MIQIETSDTIIDILKKISLSTSDKIVLVFPFGHPVLHNYLSLKVIKAKTEPKVLQILSNDQTSRKIGKKLGIQYGKNKSEASKEKSERYSLLRENYTFYEYACFEFKRYMYIMRGNIHQNRKFNSLYYLNQKNTIGDRKILVLFIAILILIFSIFSYIYYFALNKTIVSITPEVIVETKARNFSYIEGTGTLDSNNGLHIPIERISQTVHLKKLVAATGVKQDSLDTASGKATFTNLLQEKVSIREDTTFENEDGIEFTNKEAISIPAATKSPDTGLIIPGNSTSILYGKIQLKNGEYSGETANISTGELLIAPKLGENRTRIFAKSITAFTGGTNNKIHYILEDDIKNGIISLEEDLRSTAIKSLHTKLAALNQKNNIQKDILPVDNIYKYSEVTPLIPEYVVEGFEQDTFEISGSITITSYLYNVDGVASILSQIISEHSLHDLEKIHSINPDSLRFSHTISRNDLAQSSDGDYYYKNFNDDEIFKLKATTEIEYYSSKRFSQVSSNFLQKIRHQIAGVSMKEAEKILLNSPDINNVSIKVTPFFLKTTSKLPNNIIFEVNNTEK